MANENPDFLFWEILNLNLPFAVCRKRDSVCNYLQELCAITAQRVRGEEVLLYIFYPGVSTYPRQETAKFATLLKTIVAEWYLLDHD